MLDATTGFDDVVGTPGLDDVVGTGFDEELVGTAGFDELDVLIGAELELDGFTDWLLVQSFQPCDELVCAGFEVVV